EFRPLGIPNIYDRLVQLCFKQILEPIVENKLHKNSFGFRPRRSAEHVIANCSHTYLTKQRRLF
ncbi:MAG: group II intron reverse transcriptase/maturase, partial [Fusobacteriaceae bacterium]